MKITRVILADDHALVRAGIRSLLEKIPSIAVVAEAGDGREALALVKKHQPTLVLMDIAMPELNGLEAAARITKNFPGVKVIILSMHFGDEYVRQAFRAGASGYLLKDGTLAEMELAIEAVGSGGTFLSPRISRRVIESYLERVGNDSSLLEYLTPRGREILQLIAEGKSTKEIAFLLALSIKTVEAHRARLMARLDIHNVPGLVRYAMQVGLVPPELPQT
ncbi:MAG: response regulator transcription factor [Verrucomicrobiota bacterium]|nr:response regulator transcription factor [Verrucomicrobiota bacterium]